MARFRVIAGPNGSGKTTITKTLIKRGYISGAYVNADEIESEFLAKGKLDFRKFGLTEIDGLADELNQPGGLMQKSVTLSSISTIKLNGSVLSLGKAPVDAYFAAAICSWLVNHLLKKGVDLAYETVMSDRRKTDLFKFAHAQGYRNYLYFICTDSPNINILRIDQRVKEKGHDVQDEKVIERYHRIFEHLPEIISLTDRAYFFDNSGDSPKLFMESESGQTFNKTSTPPRWFIEKVYPFLGGK